MAEKNYITPDGYKRLVDELTELATVERPKVVREVSDAAAEGDRSENAAYIYGKRRLREIDRRMGFLQRRLEHVQVVKAEEQQKDKVRFGAFVTIEDEEGDERVFQIVGVDEVDAKHGEISWKSPVGRALLGKQIDDDVRVRWDQGERELTIVDIALRRAGGQRSRRRRSGKRSDRHAGAVAQRRGAPSAAARARLGDRRRVHPPLDASRPIRDRAAAAACARRSSATGSRSSSTSPAC